MQQRSRMAPASGSGEGEGRRTRAMFSGVAGWLAALAALTLIVVLVAVVGAATRPLPRDALPRSVGEVGGALRALHRGDGACVRWAEPEPHVDATAEAFIGDLSTLFALDLQTALPTLAAVRDTNRRVAEAHHEGSAREEFIQVAVGRLGTMDRLRAWMRPELVADALPRLESFDRRDERGARDQRQAQELLAALSPKERERFEALVERWRVPLAGAATQHEVIERIARQVTTERMSALAGALVEYRRLFGSWPDSLPVLLTHLRNIERLPPVIERGLFPDGSVRDGWLRPFTYYPVGGADFRLVSLGPSASLEDDDIVWHRR